MRWTTIFSIALVACNGGGGGSGPDLAMAPLAEFVASESDFASFRDWYSVQLPASDPLSDLVYPAGMRMAFLNRRPPAGSTRYPSGTILVKAIERGSGPEDWEIFGMAKRGAGYNAAGAIDWEFFLLRIQPSDGAPHILSRGIHPSDDGRGDMGLPAAVGGYFEGQQIIPCNICHGRANLAPFDFMLGDQLLPLKTAE